jgi:nucleotide-binding universal stress UspA family protein
MKVLLAIDGSEQSESALEISANYLKSATQIKIISVVELRYPIMSEPFAVSADFYAEIEKNEKANAEENVKKAKETLQGLLANDSIEVTTLVFLGNPSQQIVEEAESWNADLIIVGSHGYGFWQRTMLGSVSDSVIHHAPCSVMVVREKQKT